MNDTDPITGPHLTVSQADKMREFCDELAASIHLKYDGSDVAMRASWETVLIMLSARIINDVLAITGQDADEFGAHYVDELQKAVYAVKAFDTAKDLNNPT